uniref:Importin N-terminal domain-containing protein n=1 Tax=Clastoptera arizonana TaxID=38151 RepID=A0A1B6CLJ8_9HEMI
MIPLLAYICFILSVLATEETTNSTRKDFQTNLNEKWFSVYQNIIRLDPELAKNLTESEKSEKFIRVVTEGSRALIYTVENWKLVKCDNKTAVSETLISGLKLLYSLRTRERHMQVTASDAKQLLMQVCELYNMLVLHKAIRDQVVYY